MKSMHPILIACQGFSKVALTGSKPPTPDYKRAWCRLGATAPKRHHAL